MLCLRPWCARLLLGSSILVCTGIAAAAPPSAVNLLANPGFEEPLSDHPWMPAAWDTFPSGLNTVFFSRDTFLVHSGRYAINVANASASIPMWHNWSQAVPVSRDMWGKDAVVTMWSRSNGLQGRGYVLLQATRDTVQKEAFLWKVPRDSAADRMGVLKINDPRIVLNWDRRYFSEPETDWVLREARVFIPPSTNVLTVRCGIFGTGQMIFDDATLWIEPAAPAPEYPLHTNLLKDTSFEGDGNLWEYSLAPYPGMRAEHDTVHKAHEGKTSIRMTGGLEGMVQARAGVVQKIDARTLWGKRLRLTGHIKTDSLQGLAYIKVYCTTLEGDVNEPTPEQFSGLKPWTKTSMEVDVPPDTYMVWAWFTYNAPAAGSLYYDDVSLEVVGEANYVKLGIPPPRPNFMRR